MLSMHCRTFVGGIAAACSMVTLLPQLLKMRHSGARDLSYLMLGLYLAGVVLWFIYGALIGSLPLMSSNAPAICLAMACIKLKWRSDRTGQSVSSDTKKVQDSQNQ
jgi:MtN3 and saliva related transmembrane protein